MTTVKKVKEVKPELPVYEYPRPRYFVDYSVARQYNGTDTRWFRMPMVSGPNVQKILAQTFYPSRDENGVVMWIRSEDGLPKGFVQQGMYDFRVQLEESLDEEALGPDGEGLGYTRREECFGSNSQESHELFWKEYGFDGYTEFSSGNWDKSPSMIPHTRVNETIEEIRERFDLEEKQVEEYLY